MLLTGAAGTGKSLTVTRLVQAVQRDARRVVVTASTGIAACAVGGVTLHAFAGVGNAQRPERDIVQAALRNPRTVRRWRAADCLVIEEVSMVDADLLAKVDAVARACRGRDAPMGGVQTVLVGDFHQLPPVSRGRVSFAFESPLWARLVQHTVVFREVFRQRDLAFVGALNAVRSGVLSAADRTLLGRCTVPAGGQTSAPAGSVVLCPRNDEADAINVSRLAALPGRATSLKASLTESKDGSSSERDSLRRQLERGCLAPEQLVLKVGASVVLLANLDPARGLVNGTRGVVTGWAHDTTAGPSPRVRFFTGADVPDLTGALAEGARRAVSAHAGELAGTRRASGSRAGGAKQQTAEAVAEAADRAADAALGAAVDAACAGVASLSLDLGRERFVVTDGAAAWVARVQFPLRLAWALSIHKSQGMTLDRLWVRCGSIWEAGQAYVALSRARSPEGLTLEGFDPARHVHVHPRVASFYAGLGMLSIIAALASIAVASAAITADQVTSLPGWKSAMPSKMWSGYLNVDSSTNRNLHYVFFESEAGADAPVVLWLNGGPGCSSMDGAFEENGPFQPQADGSLELRSTRWTKRAHMLYLEAPAGVGFSYSQNPNDYVTNDTKTANDNLRALEVFAQGFPEYMANDFYISGESYAGVYIPTLANAIHLSGTSSINLKGIMVGNGCTGTEVGTCSAYGDMYRFEYMGAHNLFSMSQLTAINASCTGQWANPGFACQEALSNAADVIGNINIYNIGAGECKGGSPLSKFRINTPFLNMLHKRSLARSVDSQGPVACIDAGVMTNYLNTPAVTEALHVASASKYWGQWAICSNKLDYTSTAKNLPRDVYPTLVQNYRVLIFNGDYDACVPVIDNELWTQGAAAAQGWSVKNDWHAWVTPENQVAGYATEYSTPGNGSFAFTTVHGSGHMVPQYQPEAALQMLTTYLSGQSL